MTLPVDVASGDTHLLGRRVDRGGYRLVPHEEICDAILYMAIYWAQKYDIAITALLLMSNHYHLTCDDTAGLYPAFTTQFNAWVTKTVNRLQDRSGPAWENRPAGRTKLLDHDATIRKMLYTVLNPVAAGIVPCATMWPGLLISPEMAGDTFTIKRPKVFGRRSTFPPKVTYTVPIPACYAHKTAKQVQKDFAFLRRRLENKIRKQRTAPFLGLKKALAISTDYEPPTPPPTGPNPWFASKNPETLAAAKAERATWRSRYRKIRDEKFHNGEDPVWPENTYKMHVIHRRPRLE